MNEMSFLYANSLFALAEEEGREESVLASLKTVYELLSENQDYVKILDAPIIKLDERISLIEEAFTGLDAYAVNFLKVLSEKKIVWLFGECVKIFTALYNKKNNIEDVTVITAVPLSEELRLRLNQKLEKDFSKHVLAKYEVDSSILGGVIIRTENSQTDASVSSRLESLRKMLASESVLD